MARLALEVDYPNFKNRVTQKMGHARHNIYMRVWSTLRDIEFPGETHAYKPWKPLDKADEPSRLDRALDRLPWSKPKPSQRRSERQLRSGLPDWYSGDE
jgi:hypothetical protein